MKPCLLFTGLSTHENTHPPKHTTHSHTQLKYVSAFYTFIYIKEFIFLYHDNFKQPKKRLTAITQLPSASIK